MSSQQKGKRKRRATRWRTRAASLLLVAMALTSGCFLDHEVAQYYGRAVAPRAQEFRWSDGGLPQVFDPALAAVPPDTDAVRAMFEGLTEYDPKSLAPVPGVASRWEASADHRQWTFYLRRDARWSNNEQVTANDFVRSWQRILQFGERAPHARLLKNIEGASPTEAAAPQPQSSPEVQPQAPVVAKGQEEAKKEAKPEPLPPPKFGVEAVDDYTLRVRLVQSDPNFPALVSHPVFRPIHRLGESRPDGVAATSHPVSNGAFQLSKVEGDGVVLERARSYWDAQTVILQRVRFVPTRDAESALGAYRAGDVDAVTNAGFSPLALKLLAPYKDFRRATFGALTYYSFNTTRAPFNDLRVREALSITIDRDRISEDELGGATEPAKRFLPAQVAGSSDANQVQAPLLERDVARARGLLSEAGYPDGRQFPKIRLLVNRNEQQREVAEAVAGMWRSALNVETEIILRDWNEYEVAFHSGDYDVARRSYVMQTADESSTLRAMLEQEPLPQISTAQPSEPPTGSIEPDVNANPDEIGKERETVTPAVAPPVSPMSESQALRELPAMPIYFASSYALVKPYVVGFDTNLLDAPSLKHVRIDTSWQQSKQTTMTWFRTGE